MQLDTAHARAAIDFTASVAGARQVELFQIADECGVIDVTIDVIDSAHIAHRFWRSSLGATYSRSLSEKVVLPQGLYRLNVASIQPELAKECRIFASIISRPHLLRDSAVESRERSYITNTDPALEAGINPDLMLALALKDYGDQVNLQSIRIKDLVNAHEVYETTPPDRRSNLLQMLAAYCLDQRRRDLKEPDVDSSYRRWSAADIAAWASSAIAYTSYLSGLSNEAASNIDVYCDTNLPLTQDIISAVLTKHGPKIVLRGWIGAAPRIQLALDVAEALKADPRELTMSVSTDGCTGVYTLAVPGYGGFSCPESAMVSLKVEPKDAPHVVHGRATQKTATNSFVSVADLERGLSAVAGSRVRSHVIYADSGTVRIKTLPKRGVVVQRGRDWERLTVTLVQNLDAGKLNMVMVLDGVLASGLGSIMPSDVAFTRNMDNEHPAELQEFAQRLITALSKR